MEYHSSFVTMYIFSSLGRLFEADDAISADKLLRTCIDNVDGFSKNSLRNRKIIQHGGKLDGAKPEWLDLYMNNIYEPRIKDFDVLMDKFVKRKTLYIKTFKPIRHKAMTHSNVANIGNFGSLFGKARIGEIEDFLLIIYQIDRVIFHLLFNEKVYPIDSFTLEEENPVFKDIESLLKQI